jgi:hypothetical protein
MIVDNETIQMFFVQESKGIENTVCFISLLFDHVQDLCRSNPNYSNHSNPTPIILNAPHLRVPICDVILY